MASSNFTTTLVGKDKTAAAFNSVANRAKATGSQIRSALRGAFAAAGAYMGVRSTVAFAQELGNLSDVAMRTGTSVDELTKSALAFNIMGLQGLDVNGLSRMFMYLEKNTGRKGMPGFMETIEEIRSLPDAAARGDAAVKMFGRSGLYLLPLINGNKEVMKDFMVIMKAMPGISQAAANAGDEVADSITILTGKLREMWSRSILFVVKSWNENFNGNIRKATLTFIADIEYKLTTFAALVKNLFKNTKVVAETFGKSMKTMWDSLWSGDSFEEAKLKVGKLWNDAAKEWEANDAKLVESRVEAEAKHAQALIEAAQAAAAYDRSQNSLGGGNDELEGNAVKNTSMPSRIPDIRNALIMAGSNEALRLAANGPQISEAKKQTELLKKGVELLEKTADNTAETADALGEETENFQTIP